MSATAAARVPADRFARPFDQASRYAVQLVADRRPPHLRLGVRPSRAAFAPSAAVAAEYRRRLLALLDEMRASVDYWLTAAYRRDEARIAMDDPPAAALEALLRRLRRRWEPRFDDLSKGLAEYFARSAQRRTDAALRKLLRRAGWTVELKLTGPVRDALAAVVAENVALIRSVPEQYLGQVEGAVMRSVSAGQDLASLTAELRERYGIARSRAELIARDQNNKSTAAIQRARFLDLGIERATWHHSRAGKEPRKSHVDMDGKEYDVAKGMWDRNEKEWVMPGSLVNCRCFSTPVLPGPRPA